MSDRYFTFGGNDSRNYNTYVYEGGTFGSPARAYDTSEIPGRNGALLIDKKRYSNVDHMLICMITGDVENRLAALRNMLNSKIGYNRLTDSAHPDEFYQAVFKEALIPTLSSTLNMAKVEVTFSRKPQRYLTSGEEVTTLTSSGSITNPTLCNSRPLLRVYGTGTLGVGSTSIVIYETSSYTDIDCEAMEAFVGSQSRNGFIHVDGNYPELKPGINGITLGTGISRVDITPRWWRL